MKLLFEAKTKATERRKSAEHEISRYREGKESMRLKAIELLKRCKIAQFEKSTLEEHLAHSKEECDVVSRQLMEARNEFTSFQRDVLDSRQKHSELGPITPIPDDSVIVGLQDDVRRYRTERDKYRSIVDKTLPKIMTMREELDARGKELTLLREERQRDRELMSSASKASSKRAAAADNVPDAPSRSPEVTTPMLMDQPRLRILAPEDSPTQGLGASPRNTSLATETAVGAETVDTSPTSLSISRLDPSSHTGDGVFSSALTGN